MREVIWSERARRDHADAVSFIAVDDPDRAQRVSDRMVSAAAALGRHPTGHPGRVEGTHEKSLTDIHFVLVYELDRPLGTIHVLRLIHTSRDWRPGTWPA